jgi:hypothetical protein
LCFQSANLKIIVVLRNNVHFHLETNLYTVALYLIDFLARQLTYEHLYI